MRPSDAEYIEWEVGAENQSLAYNSGDPRSTSRISGRGSGSKEGSNDTEGSGGEEGTCSGSKEGGSNDVIPVVKHKVPDGRVRNCERIPDCEMPLPWHRLFALARSFAVPRRKRCCSTYEVATPFGEPASLRIVVPGPNALALGLHTLMLTEHVQRLSIRAQVLRGSNGRTLSTSRARAVSAWFRLQLQ